MTNPRGVNDNDVRRPAAWDKVPQHYIDKYKKTLWLKRKRIIWNFLISSLPLLSLLCLAIYLAGSNDKHGGNYKQKFYTYFSQSEQFVSCGPVYGALIGHPESCPNQGNAESEGTQATNWLLVAVGSLQFLVYWRQARILTQQKDIAKDTLGFLSIQDRPYVLMSDLTVQWFEYPDVPSGKREVVARLINSGKSPAIIHKIEFERPSSHRLRSRPFYWNVYNESFIIASGSSSARYGFSIDDDPKEPRGRFNETLYFYVRVRYSDTTGSYWATSFAFQLEGLGNDVLRTGGRVFNSDLKDDDPEDE